MFKHGCGATIMPSEDSARVAYFARPSCDTNIDHFYLWILCDKCSTQGTFWQSDYLVGFPIAPLVCGTPVLHRTGDRMELLPLPVRG
jgi:hypothetical protein